MRSDLSPNDPWAPHRSRPGLTEIHLLVNALTMLYDGLGSSTARELIRALVAQCRPLPLAERTALLWQWWAAHAAIPTTLAPRIAAAVDTARAAGRPMRDVATEIRREAGSTAVMSPLLFAELYFAARGDLRRYVDEMAKFLCDPEDDLAMAQGLLQYWPGQAALFLIGLPEPERQHRLKKVAQRRAQSGSELYEEFVAQHLELVNDCVPPTQPLTQEDRLVLDGAAWDHLIARSREDGILIRFFVARWLGWEVKPPRVTTAAAPR